jgi:hypothetical protein
MGARLHGLACKRVIPLADYLILLPRNKQAFDGALGVNRVAAESQKMKQIKQEQGDERSLTMRKGEAKAVLR